MSFLNLSELDLADVNNGSRIYVIREQNIRSTLLQTLSTSVYRSNLKHWCVTCLPVPLFTSVLYWLVVIRINDNKRDFATNVQMDWGERSDNTRHFYSDNIENLWVIHQKQVYDAITWALCIYCNHLWHLVNVELQNTWVRQTVPELNSFNVVRKPVCMLILVVNWKFKTGTKR